MDRYDAAAELREARDCVERVLADISGDQSGRTDRVPGWLIARNLDPLERLVDELELAEMSFETDRPHPGEEDA
jgi:hypothetical protein